MLFLLSDVFNIATRQSPLGQLPPKPQTRSTGKKG